MVDAEDNRLVERCLQGDEKAFESIVDKYKNSIFNSVYRMIHSFDDAEEITQKVFVKVFEKLNTYKPRYKLFSWTFRIAVNETLNYINQQKRFDELPDDLVNGNSPEHEYEAKELQEKIQNALTGLDPQYRIIIVLKHLQNFSYKEISKIVSIPEKKVKSRLFTARKNLKDILIKMEVMSND